MATITSQARSAPASDDEQPGDPVPHGKAHPVVELLSLTVKADRIVARLRINQKRYRRMTPSRTAYLVKEYPTLAAHACVNTKGDTFGLVMNTTSVPHMLEHVVIELQTRASEDPGAVFVGTSEWENEAEGTACVQVSYTDDLQALRAFNDATRILNTAVLL